MSSGNVEQHPPIHLCRQLAHFPDTLRSRARRVLLLVATRLVPTASLPLLDGFLEFPASKITIFDLSPRSQVGNAASVHGRHHTAGRTPHGRGGRRDAEHHEVALRGTKNMLESVGPNP